jgi:hypothetical protein
LVTKYIKRKRAQLKIPARIAQDPKTHRDLEGVHHHAWVNSYRYYIMKSNRWSVNISKFSLLVALGETVLGAATGNPILLYHGLWGMAANTICLGINKMSHATLHYTQMSERLYNRKVRIYREINRDSDLAPIRMTGDVSAQERDEDYKRQMDFMIQSALAVTLTPEEDRFLKNRFLSAVFYKRFENRRSLVIGGASAYQAGTGAYAWAADAGWLMAYPARAVLTSMVHWHFKREENGNTGKPILGSQRIGHRVDKMLDHVARKPASYSIPFELGAGGIYAALAVADVKMALASFAMLRPVEGTLHVLSAMGNAGFVVTSGLTTVAELEQADGIDWRLPKAQVARAQGDASDPTLGTDISGKPIHSRWREAIPTTTLRRFVNSILPQVPVDPRLFDGAPAQRAVL